MAVLRNLLRRLGLRTRAVEKDPHESRFDKVEDARVDAAAQGSGAIPPGYVKSYDEGRPRH